MVQDTFFAFFHLYYVQGYELCQELIGPVPVQITSSMYLFLFTEQRPASFQFQNLVSFTGRIPTDRKSVV